MQRFMRWLKEPVDYSPPTFAKARGHKENNEYGEGYKEPSSKL
jgi:hypothetical protein